MEVRQLLVAETHEIENRGVDVPHVDGRPGGAQAELVGGPSGGPCADVDESRSLPPSTGFFGETSPSPSDCSRTSGETVIAVTEGRSGSVPRGR